MKTATACALPLMARDAKKNDGAGALAPNCEGRPRSIRAPVRSAFATVGERYQEKRQRRVPSPRMARGAQKKTATACAFAP